MATAGEPIRRAIPEEQIPWASNVRVAKVSPEEVVLELHEDTRMLGVPRASAVVRRDGSFEVSIRSRYLIRFYMELSIPLTEEVEAAWGTFKTEDGWLTWLSHWIEPPPVVTYERGAVVEERPRAPRRRGLHGVGDTAGWGPNWKGEDFRFAHFMTTGGRGQGAVIQWRRRDGGFQEPDVYLGDFDTFMAAQSLEVPPTPEEWMEMNWEFQNTFMWALERMGSFDEPGALAEDAVEAIALDASALLDESGRKLLVRLWEHPWELQEAALDWAFGKGLDRDALLAVEAAARARGAERTAEEVRKVIREQFGW